MLWVSTSTSWLFTRPKSSRRVRTRRVSPAVRVARLSSGPMLVFLCRGLGISSIQR